MASSTWPRASWLPCALDVRALGARSKKASRFPAAEAVPARLDANVVPARGEAASRCDMLLRLGGHHGRQISCRPAMCHLAGKENETPSDQVAATPVRAPAAGRTRSRA